MCPPSPPSGSANECNYLRLSNLNPNPTNPSNSKPIDMKPTQFEQCGGWRQVCVKNTLYWLVEWWVSLYATRLDQSNWKPRHSPLPPLVVSYLLHFCHPIFANLSRSPLDLVEISTNLHEFHRVMTITTHAMLEETLTNLTGGITKLW